MFKRKIGGWLSFFVICQIILFIGCLLTELAVLAIMSTWGSFDGYMSLYAVGCALIWVVGNAALIFMILISRSWKSIRICNWILWIQAIAAIILPSMFGDLFGTLPLPLFKYIDESSQFTSTAEAATRIILLIVWPIFWSFYLLFSKRVMHFYKP